MLQYGKSSRYVLNDKANWKQVIYNAFPIVLNTCVYIYIYIYYRDIYRYIPVCIYIYVENSQKYALKS